MNNYDLGKVAVTPGGAWVGNKPYERLTVVLNTVESGGDGCGYISLKNNVGVRPGTDPTTWQKSSEAGQSIYQLCVAHGTFEGTEEEFVAAYNDAVQAALDAAALANEKAGDADAAARDANAAKEAVLEHESDRIAAERQRVENEAARQLAEQNRSDEFSRESAASEAATNLAGQAAALAQEATRDANNAAAAANLAAETTERINAGLLGIAVDDGELVLYQNAETGTVSGGEVDSDGMINIDFTD